MASRERVVDARRFRASRCQLAKFGSIRIRRQVPGSRAFTLNREGVKSLRSS